MPYNFDKDFREPLQRLEGERHSPGQNSGKQDSQSNIRAAAEHKVSHPLTECADRGGTISDKAPCLSVYDKYGIGGYDGFALDSAACDRRRRTRPGFFERWAPTDVQGLVVLAVAVAFMLLALA